MTTRLVQLFARYIGVALAAIAGWLGAAESQQLPGAIDDMSRGLASAIVAILCFVVDLIIHRMHTGGVMKTGDRNLAILVPATLLLSAACIVGAPGCSATPARQAYIARDTYVTTLTILTELRREGHIDDATALRIEQFRSVAAAALDAMDAPGSAANDTSFAGHLQRFNDALRQLQVILAEAQQQEHAHDTRSGLGAGDRGHRIGQLRHTPRPATATGAAGSDIRRSPTAAGPSGERRTELAGASASVAPCGPQPRCPALAPGIHRLTPTSAPAPGSGAGDDVTAFLLAAQARTRFDPLACTAFSSTTRSTRFFLSWPADCMRSAGIY